MLAMSGEVDVLTQNRDCASHERLETIPLRDDWVYVGNATIDTFVETNVSQQTVQCKVNQMDGPNKPDLRRAQVLLCSLREALKSLKLQDQCLDDVEAQISRLETLNAANVDMTIDIEKFHRDLELEPQTEVSDTSSNAPSILEEYFDKAREVFVTQERLSDLKAEYECDRNDIAAGYTKSGASEVSRLERTHQYYREHQEMLEHLSIAESELSEIQKICALLGFNPEQYRFRRISGRRSMSDRSVGSIPSHTPVQLTQWDPASNAVHNVRKHDSLSGSS